ncbi:MAG TPA: class I SAM-dependent methyltransferase [Paracoccaceae bacterium]|nr:class I SAM-dependent methyltransferase [Paracoccaceae bacterium]
MAAAAPSDDPVRRQYEALPYPERDPADEARRLIEGSPSHPVEIDHFLFRGRRDWSRPFRALVAGGGTGDGLVMLAQKLADIGCPAELTYLDLSAASRAVAEARMAARGLSARFVTGDLARAPEFGPFDYIDCCGVLHHLPEPDAGFRALAEALSPEGGMGLMVYAPYGRTGVYPLQAAFGALLGGDAPAERVRLARAALGALPPSHPFLRNEVLGDHRESDAGLHDLLLNARDRAYTVAELCAALDRAGLELVSFIEPARYDPLRYLSEGADYARRVDALEPVARMAVAEQLAGNIKTHVAYVAPKGRGRTEARPTAPELVPHLARAAAGPLAAQVRAKGGFTVTTDGVPFRVAIPREAAPLIARIDGRRTLGQIAAGQDWLAFSAAWGPVHRALTGFNLMHYSAGARR